MVDVQLGEAVGLILAILAILIGIGIYSDFFSLFSSNEEQECLILFEKLENVIDSLDKSETIEYIFTQNENDCTLRYYSKNDFQTYSEISSLNECKNKNCLILFKIKGVKKVPSEIKELEDITITIDNDENQFIDFSHNYNKLLNISKI